MYKNRILFIAALAGMSTMTVNAGDVEGRVMAIGGKPQAGASVKLNGRTATSDARGHFHFENLPEGQYTLQIDVDGEQETRRITVAESGTVNVNVVLGAQLQLFQVTAGAFGRTALEMTQPVEIISGEELRLLTQPSLGETLSSQLGVNSTYHGPASGRPVVRGLTGNRVRVQQDGVSAMDASALSPDHAVAIEPLLIDSVEIIKGPATLLYGNGAFGGVINTTDSRIPESLPHAALTGAVEVRAGTVGDERTLVARLDGGTNRFAWHVDAFRRKTGEYEIPSPAESEHLHELEGHEEDHGHDGHGHFHLENSDMETFGGAIGGSWIADNGFFGLSVSRYESDYGIPGHAHAEEDDHGHDHGDDHDEGVRVDLRQTRYDFKGRRDNPFNGIEALKFRAGYSDYVHDEVEDGFIATTFTNKEFDARLEMLHLPINGWRGAFGVQVHDRDFSAVGEEAYVAPTDSNSIGVFLVEEREFDDWRVELGGRVERQNQDAQGFASQSDTAFSTSGGVIRKLGDARSIGLNLTRAQRMPDIEERYADGAHLATLLYEIGNPGLTKETSHNIDLTMRQGGEGLRWTVNLFYNRVNDFIYLQNTGVEQDGLPVAVYLQDDAVLKGYEAEVIFPLVQDNGSTLDLRLLSDYTRGNLVDGGNLPRIPPQRFGAGLDFTSNNWMFGMLAMHYTDQDDTAPFELETHGYTMLDAYVSYRLFSPHADWNFFLRGSNLLDEEARRHSSFVKDLAPLPGRNFTLGVRAGF